MVTEAEAKKQYFSAMASQFNRCLEPSMSCGNKAIKAHSVQNANVLDLLNENGHLIAFKIWTGDAGPEAKMKKIGRNEATTFTGLCAHHDREIFLPIDTKEFCSKDMEQLFLLAYRSVTRELHACIDAAQKIQAGYQWRVESGLDNGNTLSEAGLIATRELITSWTFYRYRFMYFDEFFIKGRYRLRHNVIEISTNSATIAASACFSLDTLERSEGRWHTAILNIFPLSEDRTIAVFSFASDDSGAARKQLRGILTSHGKKQKYEISKLILQRCENFVISPRFYNSWSNEKKEKIAKLFNDTMLSAFPIDDDQDYMLFD